MPLDIDAIQIGAGFFFSFLYLLVTLIRSKKLEVIDGAVVFIAVITIVAGLEIAYVAYTGNLTNLPSKWRIYLGVAVVVCVGLPIQHFIDVMIKPTHRTTIVSKPPNNPLDK